MTLAVRLLPVFLLIVVSMAAIALPVIDWSRVGLPSASVLHELNPIAKLLLAAALGTVITAAQRQNAAELFLSRPMEQAQVLLCLGAALIVTLIGDSLARAVGVLGGAAIVRVRSPIEDPKDATVLFVLLGLGMATGLGLYDLAILAALVVSVLLVLFKGVRERKLRSLTLQIVCSEPNIPIERVEETLSRAAFSFEPREITRGERPVIRYQVCVDSGLPLSELSQDLLRDEKIYSLSWDTPKKERFL